MLVSSVFVVLVCVHTVVLALVLALEACYGRGSLTWNFLRIF